VSVVAAGVISSGRLFTGRQRTEYRSGGALRLGEGVDFVEGAARVHVPAASLATALQTNTLILHSDSTLSLPVSAAGATLPRER